MVEKLIDYSAKDAFSREKAFLTRLKRHAKASHEMKKAGEGHRLLHR